MPRYKLPIVIGTDGEYLVADGNGRAHWKKLTGSSFLDADNMYDNLASAAVTPVSDIQEPFDGNVTTIDEVNGAPGIDLSVNFTGVESIYGVVLRAYYAGSSSHHVDVSLHNYDSGLEDVIIRLDNATDYNYRTILIPDNPDYISSGSSQVNFIHPSSGTPTHDLFIDFVSILY